MIALPMAVLSLLSSGKLVLGSCSYAPRVRVFLTYHPTAVAHCLSTHPFQYFLLPSDSESDCRTGTHILSAFFCTGKALVIHVLYGLAIDDDLPSSAVSIPPIIFNKVDFPEPDGPSKNTDISFFSTP